VLMAKGPSNWKNDYKAKGVPQLFYESLLPTFDKSSESALLKRLERCKEGVSQNQNESFNKLIWTYASKHKHHGYRNIKITIWLKWQGRSGQGDVEFGS
jgi:hypothetical protein